MSDPPTDPRVSLLPQPETPAPIQPMSGGSSTGGPDPTVSLLPQPATPSPIQPMSGGGSGGDQESLLPQPTVPQPITPVQGGGAGPNELILQGIPREKDIDAVTNPDFLNFPINAEDLKYYMNYRNTNDVPTDVKGTFKQQQTAKLRTKYIKQIKELIDVEVYPLASVASFIVAVKNIEKRDLKNKLVLFMLNNDISKDEFKKIYLYFIKTFAYFHGIPSDPSELSKLNEEDLKSKIESESRKLDLFLLFDYSNNTGIKSTYTLPLPQIDEELKKAGININFSAAFNYVEPFYVQLPLLSNYVIIFTFRFGTGVMDSVELYNKEITPIYITQFIIDDDDKWRSKYKEKENKADIYDAEDTNSIPIYDVIQESEKDALLPQVIPLDWVDFETENGRYFTLNYSTGKINDKDIGDIRLPLRAAKTPVAVPVRPSAVGSTQATPPKPLVKEQKVLPPVTLQRAKYSTILLNGNTYKISDPRQTVGVEKLWKQGQVQNDERNFLESIGYTEEFYKAQIQKKGVDVVHQELSKFLGSLVLNNCNKDTNLLLKSECEITRNILMEIYFFKQAKFLKTLQQSITGSKRITDVGEIRVVAPGPKGPTEEELEAARLLAEKQQKEKQTLQAFEDAIQQLHSQRNSFPLLTLQEKQLLKTLLPSVFGLLQSAASPFPFLGPPGQVPGISMVGAPPLGTLLQSASSSFPLLAALTQQYAAQRGIPAVGSMLQPSQTSIFNTFRAITRTGVVPSQLPLLQALQSGYSTFPLLGVASPQQQQLIGQLQMLLQSSQSPFPNLAGTPGQAITSQEALAQLQRMLQDGRIQFPTLTAAGITPQQALGQLSILIKNGRATLPTFTALASPQDIQIATQAFQRLLQDGHSALPPFYGLSTLTQGLFPSFGNLPFTNGRSAFPLLNPSVSPTTTFNDVYGFFNLILTTMLQTLSPDFREVEEQFDTATGNLMTELATELENYKTDTIPYTSLFESIQDLNRKSIEAITTNQRLSTDLEKDNYSKGILGVLHTSELSKNILEDIEPMCTNPDLEKYLTYFTVNKNKFISEPNVESIEKYYTHIQKICKQGAIITAEIQTASEASLNQVKNYLIQQQRIVSDEKQRIAGEKTQSDTNKTNATNLVSGYLATAGNPVVPPPLVVTLPEWEAVHNLLVNTDTLYNEVLTNFNTTIVPFENLYNRWNPVNIRAYKTKKYYKLLKDTMLTDTVLYGKKFVKKNLELFQDFLNTINPTLTYETDVTDIRNQLNDIYNNVNGIRTQSRKIQPPQPDISLQGLFGANNAEFEPPPPPPPPPPGPPPPPPGPPPPPPGLPPPPPPGGQGPGGQGPGGQGPGGQVPRVLSPQEQQLHNIRQAARGQEEENVGVGNLFGSIDNNSSASGLSISIPPGTTAPPPGTPTTSRSSTGSTPSGTPSISRSSTGSTVLSSGSNSNSNSESTPSGISSISRSSSVLSSGSNSNENEIGKVPPPTKENEITRALSESIRQQAAAENAAKNDEAQKQAKEALNSFHTSSNENKESNTEPESEEEKQARMKKEHEEAEEFERELKKIEGEAKQVVDTSQYPISRSATTLTTPGTISNPLYPSHKNENPNIKKRKFLKELTDNNKNIAAINKSFVDFINLFEPADITTLDINALKKHEFDTPLFIKRINYLHKIAQNYRIRKNIDEGIKQSKEFQDKLAENKRLVEQGNIDGNRLLDILRDKIAQIEQSKLRISIPATSNTNSNTGTQKSLTPEQEAKAKEKEIAADAVATEINKGLSTIELNSKALGDTYDPNTEENKSRLNQIIANLTSLLPKYDELEHIQEEREQILQSVSSNTNSRQSVASSVLGTPIRPEIVGSRREILRKKKEELEEAVKNNRRVRWNPVNQVLYSAGFAGTTGSRSLVTRGLQGFQGIGKGKTGGKRKTKKKVTGKKTRKEKGKSKIRKTRKAKGISK